MRATKPFNFTSKQKLLFDNCTDLQRKIAIYLVYGNMSQREAYYKAGGKAKTEKSADVIVSKMLSEAKVKAFYNSLLEAIAGEAIMTRQESLKILTNIARTVITDVISFYRYESDVGSSGETISKMSFKCKDSENIPNEHAQAIHEVSTTNNGVKIKLYSPIEAMKQIAIMQGWYSPKRAEIFGKKGNATQIKQVIRRII